MTRLWTLLTLMCAACVSAEADPLAATYELTVADGSQRQKAQFEMVRSDTVVEIHDAQSGAIERWERDPSGRVFYVRVFPDARKVIEFQSADFGAAHVASDWDVIRSVVSQSTLDQLSKQGGRRLDGRQVESYGGTIGATRIQIAWLTDAGLPASVERRSGKHRSSLKLLRLEQGEPAAARFLPQAELRAYEIIDFADFGDREDDPIVERVVRDSALTLHQH